MPEYSRVKDKSTGHKFTVIASAVDEDAMQVLKQDAVDVVGEPLPPEYAHESLSSPTTSGQTATTKKEKADD
ncbi:hypothetical protein FB382_004395 [Nocardioides ginsengisegetis]|uniref:Uncharacterized protein n=1 Tax=Nocardioides ginsengisegetis TaxID=661491 RepID=A0A7W3J4H4_9ACTN|nr:hypothetical protein [Nocardioides ginsengisegetis]MBA8806044.1 hypothetical protein [Nocardioides ginsengisegetis]